VPPEKYPATFRETPELAQIKISVVNLVQLASHHYTYPVFSSPQHTNNAQIKGSWSVGSDLEVSALRTKTDSTGTLHTIIVLYSIPQFCAQKSEKHRTIFFTKFFGLRCRQRKKQYYVC
jgi:hypothetical protein